MEVLTKHKSGKESQFKHMGKTIKLKSKSFTKIYFTKEQMIPTFSCKIKKQPQNIGWKLKYNLV